MLLATLHFGGQAADVCISRGAQPAAGRLVRPGASAGRHRHRAHARRHLHRHDVEPARAFARRAGPRGWRRMSTGHMRILLELRPALDGHAGIPQETRLLFRSLAQIEEATLEGLILSSTRTLPKAVPARTHRLS